MSSTSGQAEERTMVFTRENNGTSNKNGGQCFFTCEKNDTSNQKPQRCVSFAPKFPPFLDASSLHASSFEDIQREKFFSKKWSGLVSFVSLSMKKTAKSQQNNNGRGKTEREVSLSCAFYRSYFVFNNYIHCKLKLSLSLYSNLTFFLNSLIVPSGTNS